PGASSSAIGVAPQVIRIPDPGVGAYAVAVTGTGTGPYTITLETLNIHKDVLDSQTVTGLATPGSSTSIGLHMSDTGAIVVAGASPPTTTATPAPAPNPNGWNNTNVTVTLTAVDNSGGTGVKQIQFALAGASSGTQTVPGRSDAVAITNEGVTTLTYFATDNAGNQEAPKTLTVQIDQTKPVITGSRAPAPNAMGWNNTNVTVSFSCADTGSVQSGLATNTVAGQTLSAEGAGQSVTNTGSCVDKAGNVADLVTISGINIDKTPPVITVSANPTTLWPPNGNMLPVTVSGTITDTVSGVQAGTASYAVTDEYGSVQPSGPITLGGNGSYALTIQLQASRNGDDLDGRQYTITISAQDNAGNTGSAATVVTVPHDQGTQGM